MTSPYEGRGYSLVALPRGYLCFGSVLVVILSSYDAKPQHTVAFPACGTFWLITVQNDCLDRHSRTLEGIDLGLTGRFPDCVGKPHVKRLWISVAESAVRPE